MLSYKTFGQGQPILLIHGLGVSFPIWRKLIEVNLPGFQWIVIELPGIGKSASPSVEVKYIEFCADEIENLKHHLGINKWSVVAYSIGARQAEHYISTYPQSVQKVIFIFPGFLSQSRANLVKKFLELDAKFPKFGTWILSGWRLYWLIVILGFNGQINPEVEVWFKNITSQPIGILRSTLRSLKYADSISFNISQIPTIFVWGKHDLAAKKLNLISNNLTINARHDGIISQSAELRKIIENFLTG